MHELAPITPPGGDVWNDWESAAWTRTGNDYSSYAHSTICALLTYFFQMKPQKTKYRGDIPAPNGGTSWTWFSRDAVNWEASSP